MDTFFPRKDVEQEPLPPSRAERFGGCAISVSLVPVLALQMIGAVPLHAVRDALGRFGGTVGAVAGGVLDCAMEVFHGAISGPVPQVAALGAAIPAPLAWDAYFGALVVFVVAFGTTVSLAMHRQQKNFVRRTGGTVSW
ncbi:hypothetical protein [Paraburkholderia youngii]|uniref:hypothetical protein n=1 Tax=Paraburkholderia youngii TaxID=2782701 RepID=UPI003D1C166D